MAFKKQKTIYSEDQRYRDVKSHQNMERGSRENPTKRWMYQLLGVGAFVGLFILGHFIVELVLNLKLLWPYLMAHQFNGVGFQWYWFYRYPMVVLFIIFIIAGLLGSVIYYNINVAYRSNNALYDHTDINYYEGDAHIMFNDEMLGDKNLDYFPDAGAHSSIVPSSLVSHVMLKPSGLKNISVAKRYDKDTYVEENGVTVLKHKGEIIRNNDGSACVESVELIDKDFGDKLFTASGVPHDRKDLRQRFDASKIRYNPVVDKKSQERLNFAKAHYDTVADLIKDDWSFPEYEVQRPAGMYVVDTAPINTLVLAITRAGKGQTYIEPYIDMLTRVKRPNNLIINDPKGELLCKFYVPAIIRGFDVVQFNLIDTMRTDITNPLGPAIVAARDGDFTKAQAVVENVGNIFFPLDTGGEPMWPTAANNAFQRTIFGLIDYYLEEEAEMRDIAFEEKWDERRLENELDELWGHVTLYNAYQLFVMLVSQIISVPKDSSIAVVNPDDDPDSIYHIGDASSDATLKFLEKRDEWQAEYRKKQEMLRNKAAQGKPLSAEDKKMSPPPSFKVEDRDMLTHFFDASKVLPQNSIRTFVRNTDESLRAMAGSDRTIASVYGITLTAMAFFTRPTVSALTSGRPSQNFDNESLSFPRRIGVRFSFEYLQRYKLVGMDAYWTAYSDFKFEHQLNPKLFSHRQTIDQIGWSIFYFDGKFTEVLPKGQRRAYLKLEIRNPRNRHLVKTLYFELEIGYLRTPDGKHIQRQPLTNERVIRDGYLREIRKAPADYKGKKAIYTKTVIKSKRPDFANKDEDGKAKIVDVKVPAIQSTKVKYTEKPKIVFMITPPHITAYAKLLIMQIKQAADTNFGLSYSVKSSQKPLYMTNYILDELGNLTSEGAGIPDLDTMLSIGLGQDQRFLLILQTIQQFLAVYGEGVDKVIQGNTNNIVFLKSTDVDMISMLSSMSGTRHEAQTGKNITQDKANVFERNDAKLSYNVTVNEVPVITETDFKSLPPNNSIIFRAGDNPIWNRNETVLPMSYALLGNTISSPKLGEISMQTLPTNVAVQDFDVKRNIPDVFSMLRKRCAQARFVAEVERDWLVAHGLEPTDINRKLMYTMEGQDVDALSREIMREVNIRIKGRKNKVVTGKVKDNRRSNIILDEELKNNGMIQNMKPSGVRFAKGHIAREQLIQNGKVVVSSDLRRIIEKALMIKAVRDAMKADKSADYRFDGNRLVGVDDVIYARPDTEVWSELNIDSKTFNYGELEDLPEDMIAYHVEDAFIEYLGKRQSWSDIGNGKFETVVSKLVYKDLEIMRDTKIASGVIEDAGLNIS